MLLLLSLVACTGKPEDTDSLPSETTGDTATPTDTATDTDTTPTGLDPDDLEALRTRVERDIGGYSTGASVAIWKDGAIVFAEGFGSADPDADVPVTPDTVFQVGSDTKKMTAIALLQQVEAGTLSLDQSVASALPDVSLAASPGWAEATTLHHLLSHQGGLYDYTPWDEAPADEELSDRATGLFSERAWAMAPGGAMWNYSNPNFSLAGLAVERAAGAPFADVLVDGLFGPLGMDHTYAREADILPEEPVAVGNGFWFTSERDWFDPFAGGYTYEEGAAGRDEVIDNGFIRPAGLVWSTASDMCRLAGFLIHGDEAVLSPEHLTAITTAHVPLYPSDPTQGYGYGMFVIDFYPDSDGGLHDVPFWLHGGNTLAYTSLFYVVPEQDFAVCILSNGYGDDFSRSAYKAIDLFAEVPAETFTPEVPAYEVDPATHAGHYEDAYMGAIDVTWDEDHLEIDMPDLEARGVSVGQNLSPLFNEVYLVTIAGTEYDLSFIDGEDGTPSKYVRNRLFVGTRTE